VYPVPADAPPLLARHPELGKPANTWPYIDGDGNALGYVLRFEDRAGGKQFRPLTLWRPAAGGTAQWRWQSWPSPRPLYGLHELAQRPDAPVVVVEGEKACNAARLLLPDRVAVTSPHGSNSPTMADWSPLRGRSITIWPDADAPGLDYAVKVSERALRAGAVSVAIASPPDDVAPGWDAANALMEGWDAARASALIAEARPFSLKSRSSQSRARADGEGSGRGPSQRDTLSGLVTTGGVELWHDRDRVGYATVQVNGHHENWPLHSRDMKIWLTGEYHRATGGIIGANALEDTLRLLDARAVNEGPQHDWFVRVGQSWLPPRRSSADYTRKDGKIYFDLGDDTWRAVEIGPNGWDVVTTPPVKFLRSPATRPMPEPEQATCWRTFSDRSSMSTLTPTGCSWCLF
jgi:hypothetical protein